MHTQLGSRFSYDPDDVREGGFARVFRGIDLSARPPRQVAVKILDSLPLEDSMVRTLYDREVESLLTLEHPNIVQLIDADTDQSGRHYLVLEWIESDLKTWLADHEDLQWEDFIQQIGIPLSQALSFAHERRIIHRDVKPGNVLVTTDGQPKLADFGIAKIKSDLTTSPHTTVDFSSRPYAPPEKDSTYSRDVFGFGALILGAISGTPLRDFPDLETALDSLDVPDELSSLLRSCVSLTPQLRPKSASVLSEQLMSFIDRRSARRRGTQKLYLSESATFARKWAELSNKLATDMRRAVLADLADQVSIRAENPADSAGNLDGRRLFIAGSHFSYLVTVELPADRLPTLTIRHAQVRSESERFQSLDRDLDLAEYSFTFDRPLNRAAAEGGIRRLIQDVDQHWSNREARLEDQEQERLLDQWRRQLIARQEFERRKEKPARYSGTRRSGNRVRFELRDGSDGFEIGQIRRIDTQGRRHSGEVETIDQDFVELWFETDSPDVPDRGRLLVDTAAATIKIDREKAALNGLIHRSADVVNGELRDVIIAPGSQSTPTSLTITDWSRSDLDDDKKKVVASALGSSGMFAVEGPPGTGKTTFIAELVAQTLRRNPQAKILVSSQTNVALDNALVRIGQTVDSRLIVRIADRTGSRVADDARPLLLEEQLERWRGEIIVAAKQGFVDWCSKRNLSAEDIHVASLLVAVADLRASETMYRDRAAQLEHEFDDARAGRAGRAFSDVERDAKKREIREHRERAGEKSQEIKDVLASLTKKQVKSLSINPNTIDPDELRRFASKTLDILGPERGIVDLHTNWLLRLGRGNEFVEALLHQTRVIGGTCIGIARFRDLRPFQFDLCIVDEASKATATETLVPLVRARRWVLVGDRRQLPPFQETALVDSDLIQEFELDRAELETSLFDRMLSGLPTHSTGMLHIQRRMTPAIGELVSQSFYDGKLVSRGPDPLPLITGVLSKPVTWWSTSRLTKRFEVGTAGEGQSFINPTESRAIKEMLRRLVFYRRAAKDSSRLEILVIAPYNGQVAELGRQVETVTNDLEGVRVEVKSVDAVQGREADLVILSTVRSNAASKIGFLVSDRRANVALSRARRGLVIVGDSDFLRHSESPFSRVLDFIDQHPEFAKLEILHE